MTLSSDAALLADLETSAAAFNIVELQRTCARFVASLRAREDPVDTDTALAILQVLQSKRHISLVHDVAEALLAHGVDNSQVRHRYALALLDYDRTAIAESLLQTLTKPERSDPEITGAIGRVHKQRYLRSGRAAGPHRASDLRRAVEAYSATYRADSEANYYHGINTAALLTRAAHDGVALPKHPNPMTEAREIAEAILGGIQAGTHLRPWQLATAAEACLVLGRSDDACYWLAHYVGSEEADAFEYASTMRQLELVWGLDTDSEPGVRLLPLLRNRLLQAEGGAISVAPSEFTPQSLKRFDRLQESLRKSGGVHYERVFGWERFKSPQWLREALDACRSVALIEDKYEEGWGSGFVLAGQQIRPDWPARVLLTNSHVVPGALRPENAWIAFRGLSDTGAGTTTRVRPMGEPLFHSSKQDLDACVLALPDDLSDEVVALSVRPDFPILGAGSSPRAYVIGYPKGSPRIQVSLHDTLLLASDAMYAHYRSPTEKGSSGSPVFDDEWQVIALHHGSVDNFPGSAEPANEGIRLDTLLAAFKHTDWAKPSSGPDSTVAFSMRSE